MKHIEVFLSLTKSMETQVLILLKKTFLFTSMAQLQMAKVTACKAKQLKCDDTNFTKVLQKAKN